MHAFVLSTSKPETDEVGPDIFHLYPQNQDPTKTDSTESSKKPSGSIGIDEIRQVQTFLSRKPTQSPQNKAIIHSAHLLTIPAQNALLKTLEEPPSNSVIYLITPHPDLLLPTILSRVQLLDQATSPKPNPKALTDATELITNLKVSKVGERLSLLDSAALDRQSALELIKNLEFLLHEQITKGDQPIVSYELLIETRKFLQANVNVKLALDYLAINL